MGTDKVRYKKKGDGTKMHRCLDGRVHKRGHIDSFPL